MDEGKKRYSVTVDHIVKLVKYVFLIIIYEKLFASSLVI